MGLAGHDFPYADAMAKESTMVRHWSVQPLPVAKESTMVRHWSEQPLPVAKESTMVRRWSVQPPARGQRVNDGETLGWG